MHAKISALQLDAPLRMALSLQAARHRKVYENTVDLAPIEAVQGRFSRRNQDKFGTYFFTPRKRRSWSHSRWTRARIEL